MYQSSTAREGVLFFHMIHSTIVISFANYESTINVCLHSSFLELKQNRFVTTPSLEIPSIWLVFYPIFGWKFDTWLKISLSRKYGQLFYLGKYWIYRPAVGPNLGSTRTAPNIHWKFNPTLELHRTFCYLDSME